MADDNAQPELIGNVHASIDFLNRWPSPWVLTAIPQDEGKTQTQTYTPATIKELSQWLTWLGPKKYNIYFSVNRAGGLLTKKATKGDIVSAVALHVDIDPIDGQPIPEEQQRILSLLQSYVPSPSIIINSGGGLQGFWLLDPTIDDKPISVEPYNYKIAHDLGGDNCHNVDRIMRLPGTINWPNEAKRKRGRQPAKALLVSATGKTYSIKDFTPLSALGNAAEEDKEPPQATFPRVGVSEWCNRIITHGPDREGKYSYNNDRSKAVFSVACQLVRCGWTDIEIATVLTRRENHISSHVLEQPRPDGYALRQARQARKKVGTDFITNKKGEVISNQQNIRLAISRMGCSLSYNTFSNRTFVEGPNGKSERVLEEHDADEIYLYMDAEWHLKPEKNYFRTILDSEARERQFHPVLDYLAALKWDGTQRINKWLHTYAKAEDTTFNSTVGAIVLIAAVRRVRHPGCKFDEMLVMISQQGLNKSSALAVLAANENWFSDSLPLNADEPKVIEALAGRWVVEVSELRGMNGADVEHLKAFLSRQVDRARLAWRHYVTEAPRQCILVGTTNSETFLRDATGNRRFWPVKVGTIDLEALTRDRDQLWAEAAARESIEETIRLDPSLYAWASLEQERRMVEEPWASLIEAALADHPVGKIVVNDLWEILNVPIGQRSLAYAHRVGDVMRKLGWERIKLRLNGTSLWHYFKGNLDDRHWRIVIERDPQSRLQIYRKRDGDPHPNQEAF